MGGNYEKVNKEIKEVIVKYMTSAPKIVEKSAKLGGEIPMFVEQENNLELNDTKMSNLSPKISIGIETIQVDNMYAHNH